jgi:hypothetical protein
MSMSIIPSMDIRPELTGNPGSRLRADHNCHLSNCALFEREQAKLGAGNVNVN